MWEKENIVEVIKISRNKSDVLRKLNLRILTGNYNTLNRYIKKYNIDISHFSRRLYTSNNNFKLIPLSKILIENSKYTSTHHLKKRLYKEGLKSKVCEKCGQGEIWHGEKISLILDHINGVHDDNRLENLRILCPNCNATLDTHCGKNIKNIKNDKQKKSRRKKKEETYYCIICNNNVSKKGNMCLKCSNEKNRKIDRPTYTQLKNDIEQLGYCGTGRKYGVSDNAIRKWIKYYEK